MWRVIRDLKDSTFCLENFEKDKIVSMEENGYWTCKLNELLACYKTGYIEEAGYSTDYLPQNYNEYLVACRTDGWEIVAEVDQVDQLLTIYPELFL